MFTAALVIGSDLLSEPDSHRLIQGFSCIPIDVSDIASAREYLDKWTPDVIIVDAEMLDDDTAALLARTRRERPRIALAYDANRAIEANGQDLMAAVFKKPVDIMAIGQWLTSFAASHSVSAPENRTTA